MQLNSTTDHKNRPTYSGWTCPRDADKVPHMQINRHATKHKIFKEKKPSMID